MIPFGCKISVVNPLDKIFAFLFSFFFPLSSFNRKWLSSFLNPEHKQQWFGTLQKFLILNYYLSMFYFGLQTTSFLGAGSENSIVLGRFLETQVALREHVQHQLVDYT